MTIFDDPNREAVGLDPIWTDPELAPQTDPEPDPEADEETETQEDQEDA